jgi:hypothetical protein
VDVVDLGALAFTGIVWWDGVNAPWEGSWSTGALAAAALGASPLIFAGSMLVRVGPLGATSAVAAIDVARPALAAAAPVTTIDSPSAMITKPWQRSARWPPSMSCRRCASVRGAGSGSRDRREEVDRQRHAPHEQPLVRIPAARWQRVDAKDRAEYARRLAPAVSW